ncbi:MAG: hypothetical protein LUO94_02385 [Methylococcaceae bacterium]|jgi:hypothetical protein|nr:hypothetical protein [Methylococcaceae bacterium]
MTHKEIVSPAEYKAAIYAALLIRPALDALAKLDRSAMNSDEDFDSLECFLDNLNCIMGNHQLIIDGGNYQFEHKPEALINKAALRLFQIPRDIEQEQVTMSEKFKARQYKVDALLKQNFTEDDIVKIIPVGLEEEVLDSGRKVSALIDEHKAIERFLGDYPRYDISLLKNTSEGVNKSV